MLVVLRVADSRLRKHVEEEPDDYIIEQQLRIVGGKSVPSSYNYPFIASILTYSSKKGFYHVCGGSLIAPDIVLSAAHCYDEAKQVQIGRLDYTEEFQDSAVSTFNIINKRKHPNFNQKNFNYDFALFQLDIPDVFHAPITLQLWPNLKQEDTFKIMGWGATVKEGKASKILRESEVELIPNEQCEKSYGNKNLITDAMICTLKAGVDACQGDSGGPLIRWEPTRNGGLWEQVGVISWGMDCANIKYPGVYAKISVGYQWIQEAICDEETGLSPNSCFNGYLTPADGNTPSSSFSTSKIIDSVINLTFSVGGIPNRKRDPRPSSPSSPAVSLVFNVRDSN